MPPYTRGRVSRERAAFALAPVRKRVQLKCTSVTVHALPRRRQVRPRGERALQPLRCWLPAARRRARHKMLKTSKGGIPTAHSCVCGPAVDPTPDSTKLCVYWLCAAGSHTRQHITI